MSRARLVATSAVAIAIAAAAGASGCGRFGFDGGTARDGGDPDNDADAASPAASQPPDYTDGTRLRAFRAVDADGVGAMIDWLDTQLDEHCQFQVAADGVIRCLPYLAQERTYADAACTTQLALVPPPTSLAGCGFDEQFAPSASGGGHVDAIGSAWTSTVYAGTLAACGTSSYAGPSFAITGEASPDTFVAAHERITAHGRLSWIEWVADDGATQLTSTFVDAALGARCSVDELETGVAYCAPAAAVPLPSGLAAFADAACTQPVIVEFGATNSTPALTFDDTLCSNGTRMFETGSATVEPVYQSVGGTCTALSLMTDQFAYPVIAEQPLTTLARFTIAVDAGTTRVRTTHWVADDGTGAPGELWDTSRGGRCVPMVDATTNAYVCAPPWIDVSMLFYSDDMCQTTALAGKPTCRDTTTSIWFGTTDTEMPETCDGFRYTAQLYSDTTVDPATTLYTKNGDGTCTLVDLVATPVVEGPTQTLDATTVDTLQTLAD